MAGDRTTIAIAVLLVLSTIFTSVAMAVPRWHYAYNANIATSSTVHFGLDEVCFLGSCYDCKLISLMVVIRLVLLHAQHR